MTPEERRKKQIMLVEEIGKYYVKQGLQPVASRIIALLMVMDKEQYTFDEIIEELNISKGATSNALKTLETIKAIDYTTFPGDRKRYFHLKRLNKFALMDDIFEKLNSSKGIIESIVELKTNKNSENSQFFLSVLEIINYSLTKINQHKNEFQQKSQFE